MGRYEEIMEHLDSDHNYKPFYQCGACEEDFPTQSKLNKYVQTHCICLDPDPDICTNLDPDPSVFTQYIFNFKDNKLRIFLLILSGLPEPPFLAGAGDVFFGPSPIPTLL